MKPAPANYGEDVAVEYRVNYSKEEGHEVDVFHNGLTRTVVEGCAVRVEAGNIWKTTKMKLVEIACISVVHDWSVNTG